MNYPHIAAHLFNAPLLLHPGKLSAIVAGLSDRLNVVAAPGAYVTPTGTREQGGYRLLENGVAIIDVYGVLAHRGGFQADSSYVQGYDQTARMIENALQDRHVGAILLNIDSPGGEVSGAFQLAEQIYSARSIKPIVAVASDLAASAAYLIASAADSVSITPTGVVGSIGVVTCHVDVSRAVDAMGVAVTYIYAGAHKVDGNPYAPLPAEVSAQIQADINYYYNLFVDRVAAYRPGTDAAALRATEARTYIGPQALTARLADAIETPDQAVARLAARISSPLSRPVRAETIRSTHMLFGKKRLNVDVSVTDPDQDQTEAVTTGEITTASATATLAPQVPVLSALEVVQSCNAAGEPRLAEQALRQPLTRDQLNARIAQAKAVRSVCGLVGMAELADGLIAAGADEEQAKLATWDALAARSASHPIDSTPPDAPQAKLARAKFAQLTPQQAHAFIHSGGVVTD